MLKYSPAVKLNHADIVSARPRNVPSENFKNCLTRNIVR